MSGLIPTARYIYRHIPVFLLSLFDAACGVSHPEQCSSSLSAFDSLVIRWWRFLIVERVGNPNLGGNVRYIAGEAGEHYPRE